MTEVESWGLLTKDQFDSFLDKFKKRFGWPVYSRRLSFSFWDHNRNNIDTRIRITDGKAEIMQKVGDWEMTRKWIRNEQRVTLPLDPKEIFNTYQILRVLVPGNDSCYIAQFENYIFKQADFEIKLTHQTGKTDKYNFEVEMDTSKVDMNQLLEDLGLAGLVKMTDTKFWHNWNEELNLKDTDLEENKIQEIITRYL
jgi:hypothetical protein